MNKISIIIPTMWRYEPLIKFLEDLCQFDQIDEILIIDNDTKKLKERGWLKGRSVLHSKKIRLLNHSISCGSMCQNCGVFENHLWDIEGCDQIVCQRCKWSLMNIQGYKNAKIHFENNVNLGCNQGWNFGAREAKNEFLCFANDDLIWPIQTLFRVQDHLSTDIPVIGMNAGDPIHHQHPITDGKIDVTKWEPGQHTHGFGMLFFTLKSWWVPIPKDLFMYEGDAWVFDTTLIRQKPIYLLTNMMYKTPFAVTSSEFGSQELLLNEHRIYQQRLAEWKQTL